MCAVLPAHVLPVNQPDISLVDKGTGLQRVSGALVAHVVMRQAVQLLINQRSQRLEGSLVAITPGDQQPRDLFGRVRWN